MFQCRGEPMESPCMPLARPWLVPATEDARGGPPERTPPRTRSNPGGRRRTTPGKRRQSTRTNMRWEYSTATLPPARAPSRASRSLDQRSPRQASSVLQPIRTSPPSWNAPLAPRYHHFGRSPLRVVGVRHVCGGRSLGTCHCLGCTRWRLRRDSRNPTSHRQPHPLCSPSRSFSPPICGRDPVAHSLSVLPASLPDPSSEPVSDRQSLPVLPARLPPPVLPPMLAHSPGLSDRILAPTHLALPVGLPRLLFAFLHRVPVVTGGEFAAR
ncbi:hypothetical protein C2E23DRAFT_336959 [Lenzites betulinus]|nr:hypothetical protein C2E23DRAFT_336959 [Lenzites betulinus]